MKNCLEKNKYFDLLVSDGRIEIDKDRKQQHLKFLSVVHGEKNRIFNDWSPKKLIGPCKGTILWTFYGIPTVDPRDYKTNFSRTDKSSYKYDREYDEARRHEDFRFLTEKPSNDAGYDFDW